VARVCEQRVFWRINLIRGVFRDLFGEGSRFKQKIK
jgi:hypothetical protein